MAQVTGDLAEMGKTSLVVDIRDVTDDAENVGATFRLDQRLLRENSSNLFAWFVNVFFFVGLDSSGEDPIVFFPVAPVDLQG